MATLSQVGIPGVGFGILMPKLKNKWRYFFRLVDASYYRNSS
jgi:hypothetical protein